MNKEYNNSDESYLEKIKMDMATISTKYCPECKRIVPDNKDGCPICGCKYWGSNHPLTTQLIDEDKVTRIAEDTYNLIIKPFKNINCEWKNGKILYKQINEDVLLKQQEDRECFLSDCEFWGITDNRHVSLCIKFTRKTIYTITKEQFMTTNIQFAYMILPELVGELNEHLDEKYFFELFINNFIKKGYCFMDSYQYSDFGKNYSDIVKKTGYIHFTPVGCKYSIYDEFCASDYFQIKEFSKFIEVIQEFSIIPRYFNKRN